MEAQDLATDFHHRACRHRWLQYVTSSQTAAHFFRQVKDRWQAAQILEGRFVFLTALDGTVGFYVSG